MGGVILGHHQQAAGVLVDAVHDAGADLAADAGQAALAMPQQGVDQGAVRVAGCTTMPLGLLTTSRWASSYTISSGISCGTASMGFASGISSSTVSPAFSLRLLATVLPLHCTWPSATSACSAERDRPVSSPLRKRSMRWPAVSCSTTNSRCSMVYGSFGASALPEWLSSRKITSTQSATPTHTQMSAKLNTANRMNSRLM